MLNLCVTESHALNLGVDLAIGTILYVIVLPMSVHDVPEILIALDTDMALIFLLIPQPVLLGKLHLLTWKELIVNVVGRRNHVIEKLISCILANVR